MALPNYIDPQNIPPQPLSKYQTTASITKINGIAPVPDMDISGVNLTIEGVAQATRTDYVYHGGDGGWEPDLQHPVDVTGALTVFVQFGNSSATNQATTTDGWKTWSLTVPLPIGNADSNGRLTIKAIAKHPAATLVGTDTQAVLLDTQPPTLSIYSPIQDQTFELKNGSADVALKLNATDAKGVTEVKWALDGNVFQMIGLNSHGDGETTFQVNDTGKHTITVVAKDHLNNSAEIKVAIDVTLPFTSADPGDITGPIAYLADLLSYAAKSINTGGSMPAESGLPGPADFAEIFCQPFVELINPDNRSVGLQNIHQLRIAVAVLRNYLIKRVPQWHDHPEQLVAGEAEYRQLAYNALMNYLGTSGDELRRALTGNASGKASLADRLGVGSDVLQNLLLTSDQISEPALEQLFGLTDTRYMRDPFAGNVVPPQLLRYRQTYIRAKWRQQDDQARHLQFAVPMPVIDPDLLTIADLGSNAAKDLFQVRQQQLQALSNSLQDLTGADLAKFEAALELALKPGAAAQFKTLISQYTSGQTIDEALQSLYLELPAFLYLTKVYGVVSTGATAVADEWEQSFAILVQAQKLRDLYTVWRAQEVGMAMALGPDHFVLLPPTATPSLLPQWRATESERQNWVSQLSARIDQDAGAVQQLRAVVDSAENVALPVLRSYLLSLVRQVANHGPEADTAELLTAELFIDFKTSAATRASWLEQATETLQGILFALRMGRLARLTPVLGVNPAMGWQLVDNNITVFDDEWQWMGSLSSWRSAMNVFLFPENFLQPELRPLPPLVPGQSQAYREKLIEPLRSSSRITRTTATKLANNFFWAQKDDHSLSPAIIAALGDFQWQEQLSSPSEIEALRGKINAAFAGSGPHPATFQGADNGLQELFYFMPLLLAQHLEQSGEYLAALDWYKAVYAYNLPTNQKVYKGLIDEESVSDDFARTADWLTADFNPHKVAQTRRNVYSRYTIRSLSQCLLAYADDQFGQETAESIPMARELYAAALELLNLPEMSVPSKLNDKTLENTLLRSLRAHASLNLQKLRNGLNIAGLERPVQTMGTVQVVSRRPTPYRYPVLIERAKQLTATAAQIEASFLSALEKQDAEGYAYLKAQQDSQMSELQVKLQELRKTEASDSVSLAQYQQDKTQLQVQYYQGLINSGLNSYEMAYLASLAAQAAGGILEGIGAAIGPQFNLSGFGQAISSVASAAASASQMEASFERREQEWKQQLSLSRQDLVIGRQQIVLANDQVDIAGKEFDIATTQAKAATDTVNFLTTKFTNAELYDWMRRVLQRVYAFFLQQATAIARLAQAQLEFERQQALPGFIRGDYWQAPDVGSSGSNGQGTDRNGLTGSARLLQAITELDQYAFLNDKRKLQMSKTLSLSALLPAEFQSFRESGVLPFATTKRHFDQDFPGHYLRLIRQVRVSVIALIPPTVGIHATLSNFGVSRVTINDTEFKEVEIHHGAQSVALTAPVNASGVFDLNQPSEMLLPFEAIGVETSWELRLPKPANPFDFNTIADVLITIDYTALDSWQYRKQVIQSLPTAFTGNRAFSLRDQFPDQWYDLNHPDQAATPNLVQWEISAADFPANALDVSVSQLVVYFVAKDGATLPELPIHFLGVSNGNSALKGGSATAVSGIASSRRGNAASWLALQGKSPVGLWRLDLNDKLADGRLISQLIADESIADILFVVSYSARYTAWPA